MGRTRPETGYLIHHSKMLPASWSPPPMLCRNIDASEMSHGQARTREALTSKDGPNPSRCDSKRDLQTQGGVSE